MIKLSPKRLLTLLGAVLFLTLQTVSANENVEFHGFLSQGYVYSTENPYGGENTLDGTFAFREAALNTRVKLKDNLSLSGQLMYRQLDETDRGGSVDFLLLDYGIYSSELSNFGIRLGRIKNEIGLYNSSRDVPGARPSIATPIGYVDSLRDMMLSSDGISLYGSRTFDAGRLDFNLYVGQRDFDSDPLEIYSFSEKIPADFDPSHNQGLSVKFTPNNLPGLQFGFSLATFETGFDDNLTYQEAVNSFSSKFNDHLMASDAEVLHLDSFIQYAVDDWLFTFEYKKINNIARHKTAFPINPVTSAFEPGIYKFTFDSDIRDYYLQVEYFLPKASLMARYETINFVNKDLDIELDSEVLSLGAKFYIDENWTFAGEYIFNKGLLGVPVYDERPNFELSEDHWNTLLLQLTYQF